MASENLNGLIAAGDRAAAVFNFSNAEIYVESVNESCSGNDGFISLQSSNPQITQVELLNDSNNVIESGTDISNLSFENLMSGIYVLNFIFEDNTNYGISVTIESSPTVSVSINASSEVVLINNATIDFTSTSTNAESYIWDFGDGNSSTEQNPTYTYLEEGTYDVSCIAFNASCADTSFLTILVDGTVGFNNNQEHAVSLFPNPTADYLNVNGLAKGQIKIYNSTGQLVFQKEFHQGTPLSLHQLSKGFYIVEINHDLNKINKRLLIK